MPVRPPAPPASAILVAVATLALVAAAATTLPSPPFQFVLPLAAHGVHLLAAFAAGRAVLRWVGAAPREALDVIVSSIAAGLIALALITLALATLAPAAWWLPWVSDAIALTMGILFGRLPDARTRITEPWSRRDLAVVVASRLPLYVAPVLAALLHVLTPFLPPSAASGADALALPSAAQRWESLAAACAAMRGALPSPVDALLLHGWLTGGSVGALLFGTTGLSLLVAGVFMHAERHLGDRAAAWASLVLLSAPILLPAAARDPALSLLLAFAFLAFHEAADWCQKATGGKIALASVYGGFLMALSARGQGAFLATVAFVFIVQAFVDRNGFLRQVPGVLGMVGIAVIGATPFLALSAAVAGNGSARALLSAHVPAPLRPMLGLPLTGSEFAVQHPFEILERLADLALLLGPMALGLLLLLPMVPISAEAVRQAVLAALLLGVVVVAPAPHGGAGALLLAPVAIAAGGTAAALTMRRGALARAVVLFAALAFPAGLAPALAAGPDIGLGLGVILGRTSAADFASRHVPDAPLIEAVRARGIPPERSLLLVGTVSIAQYKARVRREPDLTSERLEALARGPHPLELIAADLATASPAEVAFLRDLEVLETLDDPRFVLLSPVPPPAPPPAAPPPAEEPAPAVEATVEPSPAPARPTAAPPSAPAAPARSPAPRPSRPTTGR